MARSPCGVTTHHEEQPTAIESVLEVLSEHELGRWRSSGSTASCTVTRASLEWQWLEPFERFAAMIERNWDGIAAYCEPEDNVALGFALRRRGAEQRSRVIQRGAYGLRDEEYLRLEVLTTMLPPL